MYRRTSSLNVLCKEKLIRNAYLLLLLDCTKIYYNTARYFLLFSNERLCLRQRHLFEH